MDFARPCQERDCPDLTEPGERRCGPHQRAHDRRRDAAPHRAAYRDPVYRQTRAVLLQGGAPCAECGATGDLTVDHIVPVSAGGTNDPANLQVLCRPCNSRKGAT